MCSIAHFPKKMRLLTFRRRVINNATTVRTRSISSLRWVLKSVAICFGYGPLVAVFIGRSFALVFNLSPPPWGCGGGVLCIQLHSSPDPAGSGKRTGCSIVWKLVSSNLSVCMFYRFGQVQTELSDLKHCRELNRSGQSPR